MTTTDDEAAREALAAAITQSGLSLRQFAVRKLMRDERTVRRWMKAKNPVPHVVRDWLTLYLKRGRP